MNTKKLGRWLGIIFLATIFIILRIISFDGNKDGKSITITTSAWTVVPIGKKEFSFNVVEVGNLKPKYTVSINGDKNRMYELPGNSIPHLGYGVTNIWFILKEGQGITSAKIILEEKN